MDTQDKLIQIMFHSVNTLLALVPFPLAVWNPVFAHYLCFFDSSKIFYKHTNVFSLSVVRENPREFRCIVLLSGADTTEHGKGLCHSEPSHTPQNSEFTAVDLPGGWKWIPAMRCAECQGSISPTGHLHCFGRDHLWENIASSLQSDLIPIP